MLSNTMRFKTSNFTPLAGVCLLVVAGILLYMSAFGEHDVWGLLFGLVALAFAILCFLGRFNLTMDFTARSIHRTSGFWPFVATYDESFGDYSSLLITAQYGRGGATYTLWLVAPDRRRVSLGDSSSWVKLDDRAEEVSQASGWHLVDNTEGRNSLAALLR